MKRFVFNLEAVLTVRAREEKEAQGRWAKAAHAQAHAEQLHAAAVADYDASQAALAKQRSGSFHPGDHQIHLIALENQKAFCDKLLAEAREAAEQTRIQHELMLAARMRFEVLSRLKQKRRAAFDVALAAHEEAAISDLVIARHSARRGHE